MMQRLVQNRVPFAQLQFQNRMRPDLAELLKDIYPDLQNNLTRVGSIQIPCILTQSAMFWTHTAPEKTEQSKTNVEEISRALSVAALLAAFGISPSKITILSTYLGQSTLMKRELKVYQKRFPQLFGEEELTISTVDNYQGDENEVIIVSLVRSNDNASVGFLKDMERRCVAQSRAKACVIYIGNKATIESANCWRTLMEKMKVDSALKVACPKHPNLSSHLLSSVKAVEALAINPSSLCSVKCSTKFTCTEDHPCPLMCQPEHEHKDCRTKVAFEYPACGHPGVKECFKAAEKERCIKIIEFKFSKCGHPDTR